MTDDHELWALFRAEAEEHLQILDSGLLRLETDAADRATLDTVFRSAHSLKGAARMMGAMRVEEIAHKFEDALLGAARGSHALEETTIERLYRDLDELRESVANAFVAAKNAAILPEESEVDDELSGVKHELSEVKDKLPEVKDELPEVKDELPEVKDELPEFNDELSEVKHELPEVKHELPEIKDELLEIKHELPKVKHESPEVKHELLEVKHGLSEVDDAKPNVMPTLPALGRTYEAGVATSGKAVEVAGTSDVLAPWKIETMRVDTAQLDSLLAMAGELVVSTKRAAAGRAEFEQIQRLREDVQKLSLQQKRVLRILEAQLGPDAAALRDVELLLNGLSAKWEAMSAVTRAPARRARRVGAARKRRWRTRRGDSRRAVAAAFDAVCSVPAWRARPGEVAK